MIIEDYTGLMIILSAMNCNKFLNVYIRNGIKSLCKLFRYRKEVEFWKTIYFNFHYFSFKMALSIPVFIFCRSELYKLSGHIIINAPIETGMVKIGSRSLGTQDVVRSRTIWDVSGVLVINGKVDIGRGSKICIGEDATLTLGDSFVITGDSAIICQHEITFGNHCLLSWDILLMDTDFHHVLNTSGQTTNPPRPIIIGNHVWICARNTILKGVKIADDNIIAANSTITQSVLDTNCVISGHANSIVIIKRNINWEV